MIAFIGPAVFCLWCKRIKVEVAAISAKACASQMRVRSLFTNRNIASIYGRPTCTSSESEHSHRMTQTDDEIHGSCNQLIYLHCCSSHLSWIKGVDTGVGGLAFLFRQLSVWCLPFSMHSSGQCKAMFHIFSFYMCTILFHTIMLFNLRRPSFKYRLTCVLQSLVTYRMSQKSVPLLNKNNTGHIWPRNLLSIFLEFWNV